MEITKESVNALMLEALEAAGFQVLESSDGEGSFDVGGVNFAWQCEVDKKDSEEEGEDVRAVNVWCSVGTLEDEPRQALLERLLEMNLFGAEVRGGHLGLYAPTRALLYSCRLKPWAEERDATVTTLKAFTQCALGFMEELSNMEEPHYEDEEEGLPVFNNFSLMV